MPQEYLRQSNFNGGELDPRMHGRRDVKTYYAMLAQAENVWLSPLGEIARRPGLPFIDYVRHKLALVPFDAGMVVTANGGTEADLVAEDGDLFTTEQDLAAEDHWLVTIDFGGPVTIGLVDVVDYGVKPVAAPPGDPPPIEYPFPEPIVEGPIIVGPIVFP